MTDENDWEAVTPVIGWLVVQSGRQGTSLALPFKYVVMFLSKYEREQLLKAHKEQVFALLKKQIWLKSSPVVEKWYPECK